MFCNKQQLQIGRLYELSIPNPFLNLGVYKPYIYINSGSIDIYGSDSNTQPLSLLNMASVASSTDIAGFSDFNIIPRYIAISQNIGSSTEIFISGISCKDLGAIT